MLEIDQNNDTFRKVFKDQKLYLDMRQNDIQIKELGEQKLKKKKYSDSIKLEKIEDESNFNQNINKLEEDEIRKFLKIDEDTSKM
jgi:hypothetical protein